VRAGPPGGGRPSPGRSFTCWARKASSAASACSSGLPLQSWGASFSSRSSTSAPASRSLLAYCRDWSMGPFRSAVPWSRRGGAASGRADVSGLAWA
jgi:hypothetical protein